MVSDFKHVTLIVCMRDSLRLSVNASGTEAPAYHAFYLHAVVWFRLLEAGHIRTVKICSPRI